MALKIRMTSRPAPRGGLLVIPGRGAVATRLTSHAWAAQLPSAIKVGSGDGLVWVSRAGLRVEPRDYPATLITPGDYAAGHSRLIFSRESPDYYASHPGIGPLPTDVTAPASPDHPGLSFLELTSGVYRRDILFSLPAGNDRQVLVQLREVLRWGNDILRDLPPPGIAFTAVNRFARAAAERGVWCWLVTRETVRPLQNAPLPLVRRIDALLPPLIGLIVTRQLRVPGSPQERARIPCLVPSFVADEDLPGPADAVFLSPPEAPFSSLPISYGLTRNLQAAQDFFSPAIYDVLDAGSDFFAEPGYDPQSYAFVAAHLPSLPAGLKQLSPWFRDGAWAGSGTSDEIYQAGDGTPLSYGSWDGPQPTDASVGVNPLSPLWNRVDSFPPPSSGRLNRADEPRALVAVDWGLPVAARIRLLRLGFPSDELEAGTVDDPRFLALATQLRTLPRLNRSTLSAIRPASERLFWYPPGVFLDSPFLFPL